MVLRGLRTRAKAVLTVPPDLARRLVSTDRLLGPLERQYRAEQDQWKAPKFDQTVFGQALAGADDEQLRTAALWAHRKVCTAASTYDEWPALQLLNALVRKRLAWTAAEVAWAFGLVPSSEGWQLPERLRLPVSAAERLDPPAAAGLRPVLARAHRVVEDDEYLSPADRQRLLRRLETVLTAAQGPGGPGPAGTAPAQQLPPSLLHDGDAFGPALRDRLGERLHAPGVPALLAHAASSTSPHPTGRWTRTALELLAQVSAGGQDGVALLREVLEAAVEHREEVRTVRHHQEPVHVWVHETTGRLLRGVVATAAALEEDGAGWVTGLLADLLLHTGGGFAESVTTPRDLVVANATAAALGRRGAVPELARAQARLQHRGVLKTVAAGLEAAAQQAGVSRAELLEAAVPGHDLRPAGRAAGPRRAGGSREVPLGDHLAVLDVAPPGTVSLTFRATGPDGAAGRALSGVPAAVKEHHAARLAALRAEVKEVKRTLSTERARVESLLAEGRTWPGPVWTARYRDHPVISALVTGLLWQLRPSPAEAAGAGDGWRTGLLRDDGTSTGLDGRPVGPAAGDRLDGWQVRLWHPVAAPVEEVRAWRELLLSTDVQQPFKQAFREVYLLTPAEEATGTYSNRFAAHVLRAGQAQALMRGRGWYGNALGYYDGGSEGVVARTFELPGGVRWKAEFFFDLVETDTDGWATPELASSDQVRFSTQEQGEWVRRALAEVPVLVFSEAMRDVDLFVGVTSIAADPMWITRGARDHETYWHRTSFGELTESARTRREALERLLPRLRVADRCTLTERFLEVRGQLRTYRVHLGSGNVLMSPNDEYLCIVPARTASGPKVFLPFEQDGGMLSVIISKALLLAADDRITDEDIVRQVHRR